MAPSFELKNKSRPNSDLQEEPLCPGIKLIVDPICSKEDSFFINSDKLSSKLPITYSGAVDEAFIQVYGKLSLPNDMSKLKLKETIF